MPQYTYNQGSLSYATPAPTTGTDAYGRVPGAIDIPPSAYSQVASVYPQLGTQTGTLGSNINSELMGELSPTTIAQLQQHAAQFGVTSGMPMSGFAGNQGLRSLGLNVEATKAQGQKDYLSALQGIGSTMTPQSLAADIAGRNATLRAAPDPRMAAEQQLSDWMNKFQLTRAAGQGAGGGGGSAPQARPPAPAPSSGTGYYTPWWQTDQPTSSYSAPVDPATGFYRLPTGNTEGGGGFPQWSTDELIASEADPLGSFYSTGQIPAYGITEQDWGYQPTGQGSMFMGNASDYAGPQ